MSPRSYRKRPVVIEAELLTAENVDEVARWCGGRVLREESPRDRSDVSIMLDIPTLEGITRAQVADPTGRYPHGDAVIRGVAGEFYACKPAIFWSTYEELAA